MSGFKLQGLAEEQQAHEDEFFKLNLKMVSKSSPKYANVDMNVAMAAGDVIFYMRPETVYGLTEVLIKNVLPAADDADGPGKRRKTSLSAQSGIDLVGEAADKIKREKERKEKMKQRKEEKKLEKIGGLEKGSQKRKEVVTMSIDIAFSSLQLYICAKQFNICKSAIEGFQLDLTMYRYVIPLCVRWSLPNIDNRYLLLYFSFLTKCPMSFLSYRKRT